MKIAERIDEQSFAEVFRPVVRTLGTRDFILRLNAGARTAIPRQTRLKELLPKLQLLCYRRPRPGLDAELERLFDDYLERRLGQEGSARFYSLSDELNQLLEGDQVPQDEQKRGQVVAVLERMQRMLAEYDFTPLDREAVFRIKAYPAVLELYLERLAAAPTAASQS